MSGPVQRHYQSYPYPHYPLLASVRRCDTYALNLDALWSYFNGCLPSADSRQILIAGCGTFSPYPWSVANPTATITALDLSERSLKRAQLHCILHGRTNVNYRCNNLLDTSPIEKTYAIIDSFGVLHHMTEPLAGMQALEKCLMPGGIMRVMLYSRYARREEESIRRAFRLLGVSEPWQAKRLLRHALPGSRLEKYASSADEAQSDNGIADALLHPCVHTYRIDELLEMVAQSGLKLLRFAHSGACDDVTEELSRIRSLEKEHLSPGNFILYLRKNIPIDVKCPTDHLIILNPCMRSIVSPFSFGAVQIPPRFGHRNPDLDFRERKFLRRFVRPVCTSELSSDDAGRVAVYKQALFLLEYHQ